MKRRMFSFMLMLLIMGIVAGCSIGEKIETNKEIISKSEDTIEYYNEKVMGKDLDAEILNQLGEDN